MPKNELDFIVKSFEIREENIFIEDINSYDKHVDNLDNMKELHNEN